MEFRLGNDLDIAMCMTNRKLLCCRVLYVVGLVYRAMESTGCTCVFEVKNGFITGTRIMIWKFFKLT